MRENRTEGPEHVMSNKEVHEGGLLLVCITPRVGEIHFSGFGAHVGECVEDVGEFIGWEVLWVEVSAVDGLNDLMVSTDGCSCSQ